MNPNVPPRAILPLVADVLGMAQAELDWQPLAGGRTNQVWKISMSGRNAVVAKVFPKTEDFNPVFPNLARAEHAALAQLSQHGLAPAPVDLIATPVGNCLIYAYQTGQIWAPPHSARAVGAALAKLHEIAPHSHRKTPNGSTEITKATQEILAQCTTTKLQEFRPPLRDIPATDPVFLHGDLVPANVLMAPKDVSFIDWQCPATGDACDDIATFLSPAMQILYGQGPLSPAQIETFFDGYGCARTRARYDRIAPFFHWRLAAYCLWKSERGALEYQPALLAQCDLLTEMAKRP